MIGERECNKQIKSLDIYKNKREEKLKIKRIVICERDTGLGFS